MIDKLYQALTGIAMPQGSALIVGHAPAGFAPVITVVGSREADDDRIEANIRHTLIERNVDAGVPIEFIADPRPLWHGERLVPVVTWDWPTR